MGYSGKLTVSGARKTQKADLSPGQQLDGKEFPGAGLCPVTSGRFELSV